LSQRKTLFAAKLRSERPLIMGILNATPDSFSDGGRYQDIGLAVARALAMAEEGADIIDVGGESTRPGAERIEAAEQIARVAPLLRALRRELPESVLLSVDTSLSAVAAAALDAGADIVNDVSAGGDDAAMLALAAERAAPIVLMHMQGQPKTMQDDPRYQDVVEEVAGFLLARARAAEAAGVARGRIVIDPGIGFGKRKEDNLRLLARLDRLVATGYPVLLGASRKRFMGAVCGAARPDELLGATVATTALGVALGARIFRVHDIRENRQAADVAAAVRAAGVRA
jgi:dihydropteroate synthase